MSRFNQIGKVATSIFTEDGKTRVIYHNTPVVTFNQDEIILNTGGWETPTTKTRMNQASVQFDLGYRVYQTAYMWYVEYKGETIPFENGLTLSR